MDIKILNVDVDTVQAYGDEGIQEIKIFVTDVKFRLLFDFAFFDGEINLSPIEITEVNDIDKIKEKVICILSGDYDG